MQPDFRGIRMIGAGGVSFAYLTENVMDAVILGHPGIWDIMAPHIIIEEAGGILYDWQGNEIKYDFTDPFKSYEVIASHPSFERTDSLKNEKSIKLFVVYTLRDLLF